jgi:hypothetical protein
MCQPKHKFHLFRTQTKISQETTRLLCTTSTRRKRPIICLFSSGRGRGEGKRGGHVLEHVIGGGGIGSGPRKKAGTLWNRKERFRISLSLAHTNVWRRTDGESGIPQSPQISPKGIKRHTRKETHTQSVITPYCVEGTRSERPTSGGGEAASHSPYTPTSHGSSQSEPHALLVGEHHFRRRVSEAPRQAWRSRCRRHQVKMSSDSLGPREGGGVQ